MTINFCPDLLIHSLKMKKKKNTFYDLNTPLLKTDQKKALSDNLNFSRQGKVISGCKILCIVTPQKLIDI